MSNIAKAFANGKAFIPFVTCGDPDLETTAKVVRAMAEAGAVWVPTVSTIGNLLGRGRFPDDQVEQILESALENVACFARLGGLVAAGSDAGAWSVPHGLGGETEEAWLAKALGDRAQPLLEEANREIFRRFCRQ